MADEWVRARRYILSVYWSITTLSTVGYGDWNPTTPAEMAFVVLYMLFVRPPASPHCGSRPLAATARADGTVRPAARGPSAMSQAPRSQLKQAVNPTRLGARRARAPIAHPFLSMMRITSEHGGAADARARRRRTSSSTPTSWAPSRSSSVRSYAW
jgi:hypothetical protein